MTKAVMFMNCRKPKAYNTVNEWLESMTGLYITILSLIVGSDRPEESLPLEEAL